MTGSMTRIPSLILILLCVAIASCSPDPSPQTGSQTNWLRACQTNADCGEQSCRCGVCTSPCDSDNTCDNLPGATCVTAKDPGVVAMCNGAEASAPALCLPHCSDGLCSKDQVCVAGLCNPLAKATAQVVINESEQFQKLTGIGATLAYIENNVVQHPQKKELFRSMFSELGLDILRLRNRYGYTADDELSSAAEIVDAATTSLDHSPIILLTSWSPPAPLKANGATVCQDDVE